MKKRIKCHLFVILLIITVCNRTYSTPIINIEDKNMDGQYIGKYIEHLSEKELFLVLSQNWSMESKYVEKMLSGKLHSTENIEFSVEGTTSGYLARIAFYNKPGSERTVTWGVDDIEREAAALSFKQSSKDIFYLNFMPHSHWLRFRIQNSGTLKTHIYLELDKHFTSTLDLFFQAEDGWTVKRGDFIQNMVERDQPHKNIAFKFPVFPGINTYYLRIDNWFVDSVPLRIWTQNGFSNQVTIENAFQIIVIGIFLFIFFFNIFIYISVRDISYIYLSLMIISGLIIHLCFSGTGFLYFWPYDSRIGLHVFAMAIFLSYIFSLQFCRSFIDIRQITVRIDKFIVYIIRLLLTLMILYIVSPFSIGKSILGMAIIIEYLFYIPVLFSAVVAVKKGNRSGVFLLIGIFLHYLSQVEWLLTYNDIIPYSLINYIHIKGGSFLIIMTLGLANKISIIKNALMDLNLNLEQKVQERTEELAQKTSEIKKAHERLKELDEIKSRFFANISHEIRTPLTLIISPIESFLKGEHGKISKTSIHILEVMQRNADRLLTLVNNLLDFSKIEAGKMTINRQKCNLSDLLFACVAGIDSLAADIKINVVLADHTHGLEVSIDQNLMEKAIFNLLSNAMKFNRPDGSITITLDQQGKNVIIRIKDTGIGIAKDQQETIFERFSQVDSSFTREHKGTGIGLSLTKEIIQLHGGEISVVSELDKGSEFMIQIPKKLADESEELEPANKIEKTTDSTLNHTNTKKHSEQTPITKTHQKADDVILIAEDNDDMREYLNTLLQKHYTTITVQNGREAFETITQEKIDLVLADIMMPEKNGYELVQSIRSVESLQELPIILLTAKSETDEKVEGIEKGANDYITKPFSPNELTARIRSQLKFIRLKKKILTDLRQKTKQKPITDTTKLKIETIKDFLIENFAENHSRQSLASAVNMSPDHLSRMFKQHTGEKIADFLNKIRIQKSAELLKKTDDKIIAIAYTVGFESLRTFNKIFLDIMGISPSSYRKH